MDFLRNTTSYNDIKIFNLIQRIMKIIQFYTVIRIALNLIGFFFSEKIDPHLSADQIL